MNSILALLLLAPAAAISFGSKKATTVANPFESMPGGFGWAQSKGLAYSFGKPFSQEKFPDLVPYVQEAEIKHARVAMLAAVGFPLQEQFHPLFGGDIDAPSYISFQMTPLQTFWPIVADLRAQELAVGRLAMLGIAGMVAQEVSTQAWLFTWFETI
ncbi:chlorophyll A-B binding protein [Aureococcus anophagefferens]|nr:chlorophyll A-B binding protein [Aureococcus anophagefferens]